MRSFAIVTVVAAVLIVLYPGGPTQAQPEPHTVLEDDGVVVAIKLTSARQVRLIRAPDGRFLYAVDYLDRPPQVLTPEAFSELLHRDRSERPWWGSLLNVSSWMGIAWVAVGFLGQLMFAGRMFVQWLASEKRKRSFVPVSFWWMSLAGASMVLIYFIWRRDPVGVIGQMTGWTIYLRNLWFIYRARSLETGSGKSEIDLEGAATAP